MLIGTSVSPKSLAELALYKGSLGLKQHCRLSWVLTGGGDMRRALSQDLPAY